MLPTLLAVWISQPSIQGSLDKEIIRRTISRRIGAIKTCYERWSGEQAPRGIEFVIGPSGNVQHVELGPGVGANLAACLRRAMHEMKFPAPEGGGSVSVRYPLMFLLDGRPGGWLVTRMGD